MKRTYFKQLSDDDLVVESLPDDVAAAIEVRDNWLAQLPPADGGLEFFVDDLQRWTPGSVVRVAFLGGTTRLHRDIATVAGGITQGCNISLDFGLDPATGRYRTWSEKDTDYKAEIRVSFDQQGYFSLVGTDSVDPGLGAVGPVGGNPGQRSLNLGGYHVKRPLQWEGTVRHEFLHALAFHHEHQNYRGPCANEFRWDDDPGYQPTTDSTGRYVNDSAGRRPGIYTFLAGFPNHWSRSKVDHNLRQLQPRQGLTPSPFDPASVMLYRFPALFYRSQPSPCAPTTDGQKLSPGDIAGLQHLYPTRDEHLAQLGARSGALALHVESALAGVGVADGGDELLAPATENRFGARAIEILRARAAALP